MRTRFMALGLLHLSILVLSTPLFSQTAHASLHFADKDGNPLPPVIAPWGSWTFHSTYVFQSNMNWRDSQGNVRIPYDDQVQIYHDLRANARMMDLGVSLGFWSAWCCDLIYRYPDSQLVVHYWVILTPPDPLKVAEPGVE